MKTIDDVVRESIAEYQMNSGVETKRVYLSFLQGEVDSKGWKGFQKTKRTSNFSYLCAKLFLFSVMAKMTPVKENYMGEPVIIKDMKPLASRGNVFPLWQDERLYRAFDVFANCSKSLSLPTYIETINELGSHPVVVKSWGGPVCYDANYTRRPNRNSSSDCKRIGLIVERSRPRGAPQYMRD